MVTLIIKDYGSIELKMDYKNAPNTAANFVALARSGFYDGLTFHRVIKGFMIQGGDPNGMGNGGPGYSIKGEFKANGFPNGLSHKRGVISMARTQVFDSAGSQFFICDADDAFLDGQYAAFGEVTSGMDVVDAIAKQPVSRGANKPLKPIIIEKAVVADEPTTEVAKVK